MIFFYLLLISFLHFRFKKNKSGDNILTMATVFELIRDNKIPSVKTYEDDLCFVILDLSPVNKGHSLVISKEPEPTFDAVDSDTLHHMIDVAKKVDAKMRSALHADGTNIVINNGPASGQEVPHLHIHVIPRFDGDGKTFVFPSKEKYSDGEMEKYGELLKL